MFKVVNMYDGVVMGDMTGPLSYMEAKDIIRQYVEAGGDIDDLAIIDCDSRRLVSYALDSLFKL